jgi:hypothetical protein
MSDEVAIRYPTFNRMIKRDNTWITIMIIVIIVLVITLAINLYAIFRGQSLIAAGTCSAGLCAVSIATGVKRCPSTSTGVVQYNIGFEDCTSQNYCQSPLLPCAVLQNGNLNCNGNCGSGNNLCRCAKIPSSTT